MIELSEATRARIGRVFPAAEIPRVEAYLRSECGDTLPLMDPGYTELAERIRFAVLKLSAGDYAGLQRWVAAAKTDWRDVLVSAGFANDLNAHLSWNP